MLSTFILSLPIFLFAIIAHEYSHGLTAYLLGDPTPKLYRRLTLNPVYHIDLFGTVILPLILVAGRSPVVFGWAKPVPINFSNFKNPRIDTILVGLSGPLANLGIAIFISLLLRLNIVFLNEQVIFFIKLSVLINLVLAIFNLLPIPPLDGSKVVLGILPKEVTRTFLSLEPYGIILLVILLWMGIINRFVLPLVLYLAKILCGSGDIGL